MDLVVVGTGGGGLAATTLAAESGSSVIAVEKEGTVGGATRHALGYVILPEDRSFKTNWEPLGWAGI